MGDSIWDDVVFDHSAANEAASGLESAAGQLDRASTDRAGQAKHAREDWSGATREQFDRTLDPALAQAGYLADALRRAAGTIRQAMEHATIEQQRRLTARDAHPAPCGVGPK
ncbi:MAG: hypothetical protein ACRDRQ_10950 [Pseudonocardiaceae bacterium]